MSFAAASLASRWSFGALASLGRPPCCASACANSPALLLSMTRPAASLARSASGRTWLRSTVFALTPIAWSSRERNAGAAGPRYSFATPRSSRASAFTLLLATASGLVGQSVEAQGVEHSVECRCDLVRDVVAASCVEVRFPERDIAGRDLGGLSDETAERSDEGTREQDPDDERKENAHDEHETRVEGGVVRGPRVRGEWHSEDVAPWFVDEARYHAALLGGAGAKGEGRIAACALRQTIERGLEGGKRVDD